MHGSLKPGALRRPMQIAAFLRKEALDVTRQPILLLTLVFGPFLVMAIFGAGYRETPRPLTTLFVSAPESPFTDRIQGFADEIGDYVEYAGVTSDAATAERRLRDGEVDVVVTFPPDPLDTVLEGDRAPITVAHMRLDPIEQTAITFAARLGVEEINAQILADIVQRGQQAAEPTSAVVAEADEGLDAIERAMMAADADALKIAVDEFDRRVDALALSVQAVTTLTAEASDRQTAERVSGLLTDMRAALDTIAQPPTSTADGGVDDVRNLLRAFTDEFRSFANADPAVLVRPFESRIDVAVDGSGRVAVWYAPAAVILMVQQFGVAFGALSFVRERRLGIVDVYRVAPINAAEALIGKYLAYLLVGAAIAAALLALVVTALGVTMAGSLVDLGLVVVLTLFASVGLGFVISLVSASDAHAVQYTMILLLASLFFSGFFLSLGQLDGLAQVLSLLLPVSYGMQMLRDVMLLGDAPNDRVAISLGAYGAVMFVLALIGARRRMGSLVSTS